MLLSAYVDALTHVEIIDKKTDKVFSNPEQNDNYGLYFTKWDTITKDAEYREPKTYKEGKGKFSNLKTRFYLTKDEINNNKWPYRAYKGEAEKYPEEVEITKW